MIRKSTWLIVLYAIKYIFLLFILFYIAFLSFKLKDYITNEDAIYFIYILGILVWILMLYIFIKIIMVFIKFFYSVEIINETKLYKLNIGLFHLDNISVTNMSNIQEVKSKSIGFFKILLGISDIHIVEQRDTEKVIHCVDDGKKIVDIISDFKDKLVKGNVNKI